MGVTGWDAENWDLGYSLKQNIPVAPWVRTPGILVCTYVLLFTKCISFFNCENPPRQTERVLLFTSSHREEKDWCLIRDMSYSRSYSYYLVELEIKPKYSGSKIQAPFSESMNYHYKVLSLHPTTPAQKLSRSVLSLFVSSLYGYIKQQKTLELELFCVFQLSHFLTWAGRHRRNAHQSVQGNV